MKMKFSISLFQFLIPLVCIINAANAFVTRGTPQLTVQGNLQRKNVVLFQEQPTLEKEAAKTEKSAVEAEEEEELSETQKLMKQVKEAGTAGVISYALWEMGFWALSVRCHSLGQLNLNFPMLFSILKQSTIWFPIYALQNCHVRLFCLMSSVH
jgi:hypothetical protein